MGKQYPIPTTRRCVDCDESMEYGRDAHICPATCPNGEVGCPGPGVTVLTSDVCRACRAARRRVVLPLENR